MSRNMKTKRCTKCKKIKPLSDFYKDKYQKSGYTCGCISCEKLFKKRNYLKHKKARYKYYLNNRDKRIQQAKIWKENNKDKVKINYKRWVKQNYDKYRERINNWRINNPERIQEYGRRYRSKLKAKDKISRNLSRNINHSLNKNKNGYHWESIVNYTRRDLITHLEKQFKPGMTWNNYGLNGWHIDHIIPISLWEFDSYEDREFKQCWALCNLQPLWEFENCSKNNRILS